VENILKLTLLVTIWMAAGAHLELQAFENLGFDDANTNELTIAELCLGGPCVAGHGTIESLLPGWMVTSGDHTLTSFSLNSANLAVSASLLDSVVSPAIEGRFGVFFRVTPGVDFSLRQTGLVPADAAILSFRSSSKPLGVSFNGQGLSLLRVTDIAASYQEVAMDISPFAGLEGELRFDTYNVPLQTGQEFFIDSVAFAIPEPRPSVLLLLVGILLFYLPACCARKR
jgi:hypothetical protein